jgi:hypothetical protein
MPKVKRIYSFMIIIYKENAVAVPLPNKALDSITIHNDLYKLYFSMCVRISIFVTTLQRDHEFMINTKQINLTEIIDRIFDILTH